MSPPPASVGHRRDSSYKRPCRSSSSEAQPFLSLKTLEQILFQQTAWLRCSGESQRIQPSAWALQFLRSQFRLPRFIRSLHHLEKLRWEALLKQVDIGHHAVSADETGLEQYVWKIRDLAKELSNFNIIRVHHLREAIHLLRPRD